LKQVVKIYFLILIISGLVLIDQTIVLALQGGVRPMSMGGAFVALADDSNASTWNPAGLAWQYDQELNLSATLTSRDEYITGDFVADNYVAYSKQIGQSEDFEYGTFGIFYQDSGYENQTTRAKTKIWVGGVAYGKQFFDNPDMAWGVSVNYYDFSSQIPGISSSDSVLGFNLGFLWFFAEDIAFGCLVENINEPSFAIYGVSTRLTRIWRPGIAYYMDDNTVFTLDIYDATGNTKDKGADYSQNVRLGFEHYFNEDFSLRLGAHQPNSQIDSSIYYSFGLGWQYSEFLSSHPVAYYFDYSFIYWQDPPVGNEDFLHQVGISARF
jgi:hypothetical protein